MALNPNPNQLVPLSKATKIAEKWQKTSERKGLVINRLYGIIVSVKGILASPDMPDAEKLAAIRKVLP